MKRYDILKPDCNIKFSIVGEEYIYGFIGNEAVGKKMSVIEFYEKAKSGFDPNLYDKYKTLFEFDYPFKKYINIKNKMSISEIKRMKAFDGNEYDLSDVAEKLDDEETADEERVAEITVDVKENSKEEESKSGNKKGLSGSERGTIFHKFMELIDFSRVKGLDEIKIMDYLSGLLKELEEKEIFTDEEAKAVNLYKIRKMLLSDLGRRMSKADENGKLKKEQQFSAGIPVNVIFSEEKDDNADILNRLKKDFTEADLSNDDLVIVQGIIDAFFFEDDKIILMDYKTDYASEEELKKRYFAQLDYYAYVLEKITGLKVSEKLIYSFCLEKQIKID